MALSEIELARVRKALDAFMAKRRPPAHIREKLDLGSRISGQSVEIFEVRPAWHGKPGEKHESLVAKTMVVAVAKLLRWATWKTADQSNLRGR